MGIDVRGVQSAVQALRQIPRKASSGLAQAVRDEADEVRRDQQSTVPVKSGDLRAGITVRQKGPLSAEVGVYDPTLIYAIWIEWGRSSAAAQPFATPAAEASRNRWPGRAGQAVKRGIGA